MKLFCGEEFPPRFKAAKVFAVGQNPGSPFQRFPESQMLRDLALPPHIEVFRPGSFDRVPQGYDERGSRKNRPNTGWCPRICQVRGGDIAYALLPTISAEVMGIPVCSTIEVTIEEEDLMCVSSQVYVWVLAQALVHPDGPTLGSADDQEIWHHTP